MRPFAITSVSAPGGRTRLSGIALQPFRNVEVEELFAPDHSGKRLSLHRTGIRALDSVLQACVELVGLAKTRIEQLAEVCKGCRRGSFGQPELNLRAATGGNSNRVPGGGLCAGVLGIDCIRPTTDDA